MKKKIICIILLLGATVIWGSSFVSQRVAMDHMGPFTFQATRCFMALIALFIGSFISDGVQKKGAGFVARWTDKKLWKVGLLCGIPLFLACNLQQVGLVDTDAGKSGFLTAMYIVFVPVIGIFLRKKVTFMVPVSVALAVVGMYFLSCFGVTSINTGDLLTLGCALMFAVQITFVDRLAQDLDALRLNAIQCLVCTVLSALVMVLTETPTWESICVCIGPLFHVGVLSMGLGYFLQIVGQQSLDATPATLIMSLESVFAAIFGVLLLNETMGGWEILGCCLIFIAVILSQIPVKTGKKVHSSN